MIMTQAKTEPNIPSRIRIEQVMFVVMKPGPNLKPVSLPTLIFCFWGCVSFSGCGLGCSLLFFGLSVLEASL